MNPGVAVERLGEDALLLRIAGADDAATLDAVHALAAQLAVDRPPWLQDIVPAYATLALFVDPAAGIGGDPLAVAERWLYARLRGDAIPAARPVATAAAGARDTIASGGQTRDTDGPRAIDPAHTPRTVEIPVRYGGDDGPDLAAVAAHCGLSPAEVVARHVAGTYTVAMLGFAPGFPYLVGLDQALATPRRADPRTRVAAGSVGIGGAQTGIYPAAGPGGWQLIGRSDIALFDVARSPPALLRAGDRLRFVAVGVADPPAGDSPGKRR